jgi:hypothetical protein
MPDSQQQQPMETSSSSSTQAKSKEQQRSEQRLQEFQEAKRAAQCGARWLPLVHETLRRGKAIWRSRVWTEYMNIRIQTRLLARAKIRTLLWREWTRGRIEHAPPPPDTPRTQHAWTGLQILSPLSSRDMYIYNRAKAFVSAIAKLGDGGGTAVNGGYGRASTCKSLAGWMSNYAHLRRLAFDGMSDEDEDEHDDQGANRAGRQAPTRSREQAGVQTPASARRGKGKKSRGGH